jgi:hypothetical protein
MSPAYLPERQVEYWTSRQIEDFLWDAGFQPKSTLTQTTEWHIPADFVFLPGAPLKMFGIQYKVLYQGTPDYWNTPKRQADQIAKFDWIYYGLSDLRESETPATRSMRCGYARLRKSCHQ